MINKWSTKIYEIIQKTAEGRNVSEWCKKEECWEELTDRNFTFTVTPPEFTNLKKVAGNAVPINVVEKVCFNVVQYLSLNKRNFTIDKAEEAEII